jgi:hypothetical protein
MNDREVEGNLSSNENEKYNSVGAAPQPEQHSKITK